MAEAENSANNRACLWLSMTNDILVTDPLEVLSNHTLLDASCLATDTTFFPEGGERRERCKIAGKTIRNNSEMHTQYG